LRIPFKHENGIKVTRPSSPVRDLGDIAYSIAQSASDIPLEIDANGTIFSAGPLDFEQHPNGIHFVIQASDASSHFTIVNATLLLTDVNDNHPIFEQNTYKASIPESFEVRDEVLVAKAVDLDGSSEYSTISKYMIVGLNQSQLRVLPFSITDGGSVVLSGPLDYDEGPSSFTFYVQAWDGGNLSSKAVPVKINITNVPDITPCPTELEYHIRIAENEVPLQPLLSIETNPIDHLSPLTYRLTPLMPQFEFREGGKLFLLQPLDFEFESTLKLNLTVSSSALSCSTPSIITVSVQNRPDSIPKFSQDIFEVSVRENVLPGDLLVLNTTDENGRPFFSVLLYEIDPPYVPFRVSGGYLQNTIPLDAEVNLTYVFQVWASDIGGLKSQPATVIVSVLDENEYIPTFSELIYEAEVQENGDTGMLLLTVSATDEDEGEINTMISHDKEVVFARAYHTQSHLISLFPFLISSFPMLMLTCRM